MPTSSRHDLPGRASLAYQPALDGLRAVSVLAVMCFHANLSWATGGFIGVDVFFVLSGFLITTLLLGEYAERGRIRLGHFYMRRVLRLLPALVGVIVFLHWWMWTTPYPEQWEALQRDTVATLLYMANWAEIKGALNPVGLFGHAWSLAIEEQFYIFWPLALVAMLSTLSRQATMVVVGAAAFASLLLRVWLLDGPGSHLRAFHGSDTRAETLLAGCLLALALERRGRMRAPMSAWMVVPGAVGTLALAWFFTNLTLQTEWLLRGGLTLVAVSATLVVLSLQAAPESPMARALSWDPLVKVGRISYGLYLWHWPLFLILLPVNMHAPTPWETAVRFAATFLAAWLSWYLIERPALAWKKRWA